MPATDTSIDTSSDTCKLLHLAYRVAGRIVHNKLLAEEAGERAVHRFQLAVIAGHAPDKPEAWVRTVAKRSACAILRNGWSRTQPIAEEQALADRDAETWRRGDRLRLLLERALTPRQQAALEAALTCRTTRDAARTCGMEPRDFRRYLAAISRRARRRLEEPEQQPCFPGHTATG
jgi:DNA-directed RNA polymerase specialized sigma24 family protein